MFFSQADRLANKPLFFVKHAGRYQPITWGQARQTVEALGTYLLQVPVNPGDRVLLLSENRPEWGIADLAIQSVRARTVPVQSSTVSRSTELPAGRPRVSGSATAPAPKTRTRS